MNTYQLIHSIVLETLNKSAPGLTDPIKNAIAISVALKLRDRVEVRNVPIKQGTNYQSVNKSFW